MMIDPPDEQSYPDTPDGLILQFTIRYDGEYVRVCSESGMHCIEVQSRYRRSRKMVKSTDA